ncbi:MAG: tRNA pseudouridine(55) synthase TruB [Lachnospiraceae bacterium]|nr:tRNA pseudouridine(55) synthase TruB [Lachnospiraceae bacterium]
MNGILNIYKERGYTSHDVIARLRGITHQRKMGHTGTLDPDAEGVLPVCLGTATRVCDIITDNSKCYEVIMLLGIGTDSQDITGEITGRAPASSLDALTDYNVRNAIMSFVGEYDQLPPMYSAVRMGGQRLYDIARAGREIEREPRHVVIDSIEIVSGIVRGMLSDPFPYESLTDSSKIKLMKDRTSDSDRKFTRYSADTEVPGIDTTVKGLQETKVIRVAFSVKCSKGTYIRSLCSDIGDKLGVFGCVERLMRTKVNIFDINSAITLREAEELMHENRLEEKLTGSEKLFESYKRLDVKEKYDDLLANGNQLHFRHFKQYITEPPSPVRVYSSGGEFLGIYEYVEGRFKYTPVKVFIEKE